MPSSALTEVVVTLTPVASVTITAEATFVDNFNDNDFDTAKWSNSSETDGTIAESGGTMRLTSGATGGRAMIETDVAQNLTNTAVQVKATAVPVAANGHMQFYVLGADPGNNYYRISYDVATGNLILRKRVAGVSSDTTVAFNAGTMIYWRIRHDSGTNTIYWETSADSVTWTERRNYVRGSDFAITAMTIWLRSDGTSALSIFDGVVFGAYSTAPTVSFAGGGGTGAAGTAVILDGRVSSVTITNGGGGYTSAPTVSFSGGGGTGAAGTAVLGTITLGAVTDSAEQDGHLYIAAGQYILKITNGNDPGPIIAADKNFGATIRAYSLLAFDGSIWAGTYNSGATLWKLPAGGGSWTNTGTPPGVKKLETVFWETEFEGVYAGRHEMVGTENSTSERTIIHVPAGADPLDGADWSGSIKIGPGTSPINSLTGSNRHIFAPTSSGVADIDTLGNSPILNPDQAQHRDDVINGAASLFHSGYVYFSDTRGICRIDVGSAIRHDENTLCGPGVGLSNETPVFGAAGEGVNPYAFTQDGGWVILSVWNGTDSYINYGRDDGRTDPAGRPIPTWHLGEYYIPDERVTHMRVTTPANEYPRLWICSIDTDGLVHIRWAMLDGDGSPLQEYLNHLDVDGIYTGPKRWVPDAKLYLTGATWDDDNARKVLLRWDVRANYLTTATYLRIFAKDEASSSYVQQGGGADPKIQRSPRSELLPTAAGTDTITIGHAIDVRLDFIGTATAPAVLRQVQSRAEVVAEMRDARTYLIELAGAQTQRNGGIGVGNPEDDWTRLKRLQTNQPVRFIDEMGTELLVRVEPGIGYREQLFRADAGDQFRRVLVARMTVSVIATDPAELGLDVSGPVTPPSPPVAGGFRWGDGTRWGSGARWS